MYKIEEDYGLVGILFTLKDGSTKFVKNERNMNITEETSDTRQKTIKEPKTHDSTKIAEYCKKHWGELVNWDKKEKILYLCDNSILGTPEFLELLKKYKLYIQPSLF